MKTVAALVALVLLALLISPAMAGVGPSPFRPELGKLNAIVNGLSELQRRVGAAVPAPDTPRGVEPSPFRDGANQLIAAAHQLLVLGSRLERVLAVQDVRGDDAVNSALREISRGAEAIADLTQPDDVVGDIQDELETAKASVYNAALAILNQLGDVGPSPD
jgi:hypothetical protein